MTAGVYQELAAEALLELRDELRQVIAAARSMLDERIRPGAELGSPAAAADYLTLRLADRFHEVFTVLYLDGRNRLIACSDLFRGTISGARGEYQSPRTPDHNRTEEVARG